MGIFKIIRDERLESSESFPDYFIKNLPENEKEEYININIKSSEHNEGKSIEDIEL